MSQNVPASRHIGLSAKDEHLDLGDSATPSAHPDDYMMSPATRKASFTDEFLSAVRLAQDAKQFEPLPAPTVLNDYSAFVQELHATRF